MVYNVIGLMSGSSLDGLDIAFVELTETGGIWSYQFLNTDFVPYGDAFRNKLHNAAFLSVPEFLRLHTALGRFFGAQINGFIEKNGLWHKVHFIASHGHTIYHNPAARTSVQIGDGATIAAMTNITTVSDLRNMDVALGGQGAPIVPVADRLLFNDYDFCLNIGGITNLTENGKVPAAYDICPANQCLNFYAEKAGQPYDDNGRMAAAGQVDATILAKLNEIPFYQHPAPKSLDNNFFGEYLAPYLNTLKTEDALRTAVVHIAWQIGQVLKTKIADGRAYRMLITGGGALNRFLVEEIDRVLSEINPLFVCEVPDENLVFYKEALAMALIGTLRWREENNVLGSVTGADRDSVGGAIWMGNQ